MPRAAGREPKNDHEVRLLDEFKTREAPRLPSDSLPHPRRLVQSDHEPHIDNNHCGQNRSNDRRLTIL